MGLAKKALVLKPKHHKCNQWVCTCDVFLLLLLCFLQKKWWLEYLTKFNHKNKPFQALLTAFSLCVFLSGG